MKIKKVLISEKSIRKRVAELGAQITADYKDSGRGLLFIGILRGSVVFYADLVRKINRNVHFDFMSVSSYGTSSETTGEVKILKDLDCSIENKDVIIIEDIIDTGLTIEFLKKMLLPRKPNSLKICCLLDKPSRRKANIEAEYTGFKIKDEFVVGYGMDYAQEFRNLPYIGIPEI